MPSINNLVYSDKFKKWFDTTNTIITTLNGITVYNLLQGDGVSLSSSGNVFTVSHAPTVATGVTFNGSVRFNGSVSFATNPTTYSTTTINVSPKVSGITAGKFVRIDPNGLTLAKADSAVNAEVLGVVVNDTASAHVVALAGLLDNSLFANTIGNAIGTTLVGGQAYFLDSVVPGGITTNEPQTYGYVSKPVLLGVTGDSGSILTYRGVLLEGLSYGITAELDNKLIIEYDTNGGLLIDPPMVGDVFLYFDDSDTGSAALDQFYLNTKSRGKVNNSTKHIGTVLSGSLGPAITSIATPYVTGKEFLGLVSRIISESSGVYILEITLPGGTITTQINQLDTGQYPNTSKTTALAFNEILAFVPATGTTKVLDFIRVNDVDNTVKLVISRGAASGTQGGGALPPSGTTATIEYTNLIRNGAFTVWQRPAPITSTTNYTTSYTTDYLMQPFDVVTSDANGPKNSYIHGFIDPTADRWFIMRNLQYLTYTDGAVTRRGLTGGSSVYRQDFVSNQTSVPGSPIHYLDCKFYYPNATSVTSLERRPSLQNFEPNARLAQGQTVTFSFWAKSTVIGSTLDLIYNRYKSRYSTTLGMTTATEGRTNLTAVDGGITLTTAWKQYQKSFTVAPAGFTLSSYISTITNRDPEPGWFAIGFEFPSSTATVSIAQTQLHLGTSTPTPISVDYNKELERCQEIYQTNFLQGHGITYISFGGAFPDSRRIGSNDSDNHERTYPITVENSSQNFRYNVPLYGNVVHSFRIFSSKTGKYNDVFIDSPVSQDASVVNASTTINQDLPWQKVEMSNAAVTKTRGKVSTGFSIVSSGPGPSFNRYMGRIFFYNSPVFGSGPITYYDRISFNYIVDADITQDTDSFGSTYKTITIHY